MSVGPVCELCGTDEVFRTRLWGRGCLGCGREHTVCGACLSDWGLRLRVPYPSDQNPDGLCPHLDCPDVARVAQELMRPDRPTPDDCRKAADQMTAAMRAFGESFEHLSRAARDAFVSTGSDLTNLAKMVRLATDTMADHVEAL